MVVEDSGVVGECCGAGSCVVVEPAFCGALLWDVEYAVGVGADAGSCEFRLSCC